MEWVLFLFVILAGFAAWVHFRDQADNARRAEEKAKKQAAHDAQRAAIEEDLLAWMQGLQSDGWSLISRGRLMHQKGQPHCTIALATNAPLLRLDEIKIEEKFEASEPIYVNLREIISLNVARPTVQKSRKEIVPVPIIESHQRSPVARGLIGGAILGPAGLVLGAASGLNAKTTTTIKSETVYKSYDGFGLPQLIIGTNRDDYPYFKIQCANREVADEWAFRIRGRQARGAARGRC